MRGEDRVNHSRTQEEVPMKDRTKETQKKFSKELNRRRKKKQRKKKAEESAQSLLALGGQVLTVAGLGALAAWEEGKARGIEMALADPEGARNWIRARNRRHAPSRDPLSKGWFYGPNGEPPKEG